MDISEFWQLIEKTKTVSNRDVKKQAELLIRELISRPVEEILEFERIFDAFTARAYLYNLWDIADFIGEGMGDSSWWDFRAWLVGQGQEIYERVVSKPETLADIVPLDARHDIEAEPILLAGQKAYREKTGADTMPSLPPFPLEPIPRGESLWNGVSSAEEYDRRFKEKYPQIWERFGEENIE